MAGFNCKLVTAWNNLGRAALGGWPVDMSLEFVLIDVERPSLRVDGATPRYGVLDCIKVRKAR